ncbi:bifunctional chorismate mutase/prephenate dehydratase [Anaerovorax odorimutans]|uniref:bifunctional chorismate mutase/prephenate dehydratase n=1 Tax=Anaerovorax odorimutans TaxID=109327 RepID=UPI000409E4B5|nr:bifunctional chorismate mutase/prephenate dehydratase [Anaerovorax odorimutans]
MMLDDVRKEINDLDLKLKDLFLKRMEVSGKVAEIKSKNGDKILKPEREIQIIENLTKDMEEEYKLEYLFFIKNIIEVSRTYQYRKLLNLGMDFKINCVSEEPRVDKVCYQGLPCSYSEITTNIMFPDVEAFNVDTFENVFAEVNKGNAQTGIVPLENTTAGNINEVYDLLLKYDLYINYSCITKVDHCLAALNGAKVECIKKVYSHPQGIEQSKEFLKEHKMTPIISSNTAVAANFVANQKSLEVGAVCSKEAATRYGLTILADAINHNKENATKFIAVSKKLICNKNHNKIAIVFACDNKSGSLASVLGIFAQHGINLTEIHSRPDGKTSWEYLFYVDFTGNLMQNNIKALLFQLTEELPFLKILGSYESEQ